MLNSHINDTQFHKKVHLQELFNDDFNRCIEFCDLMMDRNPQF